MTIKVVIAGATGWVGRTLVPHIAAQDGMTLFGAVSRKAAGQDVGTAIGTAPLNVTISAELGDGLLAEADVLVDFTSPFSVKDHVRRALANDCRVVIGASGLTSDDFADIDAEARRRNVGVLAAGNFSVTATLMKRFSLLAAKFIPDFEIIDYAAGRKPDAPSGTGQELAEALAEIRRPTTTLDTFDVFGTPETRGASIGRGAGSRVHAIRLPSYVLASEVIFALPNERLLLRHDAGDSAEPYMAGVTLAIRHVMTAPGLTRGLDTILT